MYVVVVGFFFEIKQSISGWRIRSFLFGQLCSFSLVVDVSRKSDEANCYWLLSLLVGYINMLLPSLNIDDDKCREELK